MLGRGAPITLETATFLRPVSRGKILCVGLDDTDHSKESGFALPTYPTIFARFASCLTSQRWSR